MTSCQYDLDFGQIIICPCTYKIYICILFQPEIASPEKTDASPTSENHHAVASTQTAMLLAELAHDRTQADVTQFGDPDTTVAGRLDCMNETGYIIDYSSQVIV